MYCYTRMDQKPFESRGIYLGTIDGSTPLGEITGLGPTESFQTPPKVDAADPARHSLLKEEWMSEFFITSSNPAGHGIQSDQRQHRISLLYFRT